MAYIQGIDRDQQLMMPEAVDDYVAQDNAVRFLDAFVERLDMQALGFRRAVPARTGTPGYDPRVLLKLYVYGYLHRIRSSRRLEAESKRNLEVIWLLGKLQPDFKTIADFRRDHPEQITGVCRAFSMFCKRLDLFGKELVGIDGSKFRAVNSLARNHTQATLQRTLKQVNDRIDGYMKDLEEGDRTEAGTAQPSAEELRQKIKLLEATRSRYEDLQKQMEAQAATQVSQTDPESRRMKVEGRFDICYNVQIAVDSKHHLIVAHDVTNAANDREQLSALALSAKEALGVETLEVVADGGYNTEEEVARCEEAGIAAYLPRPQAKGSLFPKSEFTYLPEEDAYRCPGGALLTYRHTEKTNGKPQRCYQTHACAACPLRDECTRDEDGRRIRRSDHEAAMERVYERVEQNPEKLRRRKTLVEHPFGTMKRNKGEGHFLLKGLRKVRGEFSLSVLAYNLRRVLNTVPIAQLMEALTSAERKTSPAFTGEVGIWPA